MKWEMGILSPSSSYYSNSSSWFQEESQNRAKWTPAENKAFEKALALYDKDTPDRWQRVAEMVPGKTVADVITQYKELEDDVSSIEAGLMDLIPVPDYTVAAASSSFTLEWGDACQRPTAFVAGGKRPLVNRAPEHERKKGVPWTEEEHKLFLMGLKKHGKGDWRNISRNFVITRTPTQVASHAQKFFIRQNSGGKDKRRASIHDITTVSLDDRPPSKKPDSPDQPATAVLSHHQQQQEVEEEQPADFGVQYKRPAFIWNQPVNLLASPYGLGQAAMSFPIQSAPQQYPFA